MDNSFPKEDRVCVNCEHFRRNWSPVALMDLICFDGQLHYRCTLNGTIKTTNYITGRVKVRTSDRACERLREAYNGDCYEGKSWTPSKKFKNKKENLFKIIKHYE